MVVHVSRLEGGICSIHVPSVIACWCFVRHHGLLHSTLTCNSVRLERFELVRAVHYPRPHLTSSFSWKQFPFRTFICNECLFFSSWKSALIEGLHLRCSLATSSVPISHPGTLVLSLRYTHNPLLDDSHPFDALLSLFGKGDSLRPSADKYYS